MAIYKHVGQMLRWTYSGLKTPPVLNAEELFPEYIELVRNFHTLRAEAAHIGQAVGSIPRFHELLPSQAAISANDGKDWRLFVVKSYGHEMARNLLQTPFLARFLQSHPHVISAVYSFLEPGKHIPPHRGPFRGIARYQLCLMCGQGTVAPYLRLADEIHPYHEGSWLLWDDTYVHEVVNDSATWRVALLLDVRRRDLPPVLSVMAACIVSAGHVFCWAQDKKSLISR
jgi:aspartate beta-hydroxylase